MLPSSAGTIATSLAARLVGDGDLVIHRLDTIEAADAHCLTFIRSERFARRWLDSAAGAALIAERDAALVEETVPAGRALLVVADADLAMLELLKLVTPPIAAPPAGVHPTAFVDPSAEVHPTASVGAHVVVGAGCRVGAGVVLHAGVVLGAGVVIGEGSDLRPQVVVMDRCVVGRGCILHSHVTIGADGFGYRPDPSGRGIIKIPHAGTVELGDGVEVGANTAIDRGKFGATVVGAGTKIDNLCQIGHNVCIGRCCIICGHCAIGGSARIGDGVTLAGCVAVADNVVIGAGATLGALSGVIADVPEGVMWLGHPAGPHRDTLRQFAAIRELPAFLREQRRRVKGGTDGG